MQFLKIIFSISTLIIFLTQTGQAQTDLKNIPWEKEKITKGLQWKHIHTEINGSKQNLNVLEINLRKRSLTLVYSPEKNIKTSELAAGSNGLAAINAGFFDVKNGGSVTFIQVDGLPEIRDTLNLKKTETLNGAFIIKQDGNLEIELAKVYRVYLTHPGDDDILITGPVLIDDGEVLELPKVPFVENRHPRSCLCINDKNKILLITVDGRSEESAGMDLKELTQLVLSLNCREAINLDGGGSTTLWIPGKGGVVNMPSDNKVFDHLGERPVSNILLVK